MAPLPPVSPPPPEAPGARVRARTRTAVADENVARQDATEIILAKLRAMIASGTQDPDAILGTIAVAAHALTEASGAAIAMPRDGVVVCVGRSGETAPELGTRLNVDSGISGECLRTGMILRCDDAARNFKVDSEVCHQLGLQSISVVPLRGRHGRVGVLEVFSTQSYAFSEEHTNLLGRLAVLAETAWARATSEEPPIIAEAAEEFGATATFEPSSAKTDRELESLGLLAHQGAESADWQSIDRQDFDRQDFDHQRLGSTSAALERVGEAIAIGLHREQQAERRWNIALMTGLFALVLLLVSVLGWKAWYRASIQSSTSRSTASPQTVPGASTSAASAAAVASKPGAERPVGHQAPVPAARTERPSGFSKMSDEVIQRILPSPENRTAAGRVGSAAASQSAAPQSPSGAADIPQVAAASANPGDLRNVLSAAPALPSLGVAISQGVAGGILVHRVQPVYPAEARRLRLEGNVVLEANITEDGHVDDLKVMSGHPLLAQSAMEAVSKWRYAPYLLNGRPIRKPTRININFIAP